MGAEVAFLVKFSCSYSMHVMLSLVERTGGTLWDLIGRPALALLSIEPKELLLLPEPVVAIIRAGPKNTESIYRLRVSTRLYTRMYIRASTLLCNSQFLVLGEPKKSKYFFP